MLAILGGVIAAVSVIEVIGTGPAGNSVPVYFGPCNHDQPNL
jgi:hypothetical protein